MGYLMIDERASGGAVREYDTIPCGHCQAVISKKKWAEDGGIWKCSGCQKPMCPHCSGVAMAGGGCDPWQEKIDRQIKYNEMVVRG